MRKRILFFKVCLVVVGPLLVWCTGVPVEPPVSDFSFTVVDVGQGLSQVAVSAGKALVWDVGDTFASARWRANYQRLGSPKIGAIVVSHSHRDHCGGLSSLPPALNFSGLIVTHPFEDTGYIRHIAAQWRKDIRFKSIAQGDTLGGLDGVIVSCMWPPRDAGVNTPISDSLKNRFSLCFRLSYRESSVLITSDIDTTAERCLATDFGFDLASNILIVPHHGSAAAVDEVFYGYAHPSIAVISCGLNNPYGFPTQRVMNMLYRIKAAYYSTASNGDVTASSNGYYWTF